MGEDDKGDGVSLVCSFAGLYHTMPEEHAFVHGVEFGELWHRMSSGAEAEIEITTHTANRVVIERAAAAKGWDLECRPSDVDGWDYTKLTKARAERRNPHGLRVVNQGEANGWRVESRFDGVWYIIRCRQRIDQGCLEGTGSCQVVE